jgi:hydroxypyruvate isomerase
MSQSRRDALRTLGGAALAGGALAAAASPLAAMSAPAVGALQPLPGAGRLKQSVCQWCYSSMPLDELCAAAKRIGLLSVELLSEKDWPVVKQHGLTCAMANGPSTIPVGFNRPSEHDRLVAESERLLPLVAAAGLPNMIVFSGNRAGMGDGEGLANCVAGLKRITPLAEQAWA